MPSPLFGEGILFYQGGITVKKVTLERCLLLLAAVLAVVGLFAYRACGVTEFTPTLSTDVQAAYCIGAAICLISLFFSRKPIKFFGFLALLYALVQGIAVQATYVTNVLVSIDGNSFSAAFLLMAIASLLAVIAALAATIQTADRKEA